MVGGCEKSHSSKKVSQGQLLKIFAEKSERRGAQTCRRVAAENFLGWGWLRAPLPPAREAAPLSDSVSDSDLKEDPFFVAELKDGLAAARRLVGVE